MTRPDLKETTMTKATEIALLDATIAKFGENSYLGPWLKEVRHDLVADIQNDLTPNADLPSKAYAKAREIEETAKAFAKREVEQARAEAEKIIAKAREEADGVRRHAKYVLQEAAGRL
jgi:cell division septum initiation protein DivIVA